MGLERTRINTSHEVPQVGIFILHPEHLSDDEIEYELMIRREMATGARRELTAKLRAIINQEQLGKRAVPKTSFSVPSEEMAHCQRQVRELKNILEMVDQDIGSQNRFMSKFLHLEGRLNRIPRTNTTHDITGGVFSVNEELSKWYDAFVSKIKGFRKQKAPQASQVNQNVASDTENNRISMAAGGENAASDNANIDEGGDNNANLQNANNKRASGTKPKETNTNKKQTEIYGKKNWPHNDFDMRYQLPKRQPVQRGRVGEANHFVNRFTNQNGEPNQYSGLNGHKSQHFDLDTNSQAQGQNINHGPRLSDHFRMDDQSISHIPYQRESYNFPPMTSSDINGNAYQNMHENFGVDMRNSMPPMPRQPRRGAHNNANQGLPPYQIQGQNMPPQFQLNGQEQPHLRYTPSPNDPIERAIIEMASAVQVLVERVTSVEGRMGSMEQRNATYTVNPILPTSAGNLHTTTQTNANLTQNQASNGNQVQADGQSNRFRRVPIHKWGFHFTANSKSDIPEERDARAFLKRLEIFRDAEDVTYEELRQKFHYLLKGSALDWYTQYRHEFTRWEELKTGFLKQYTTPLTKFVTAAKLASRRQLKSESASEYIASIIRDFDEMEVEAEEERIAIVQNGLLPDLRSRAMSRDWNSVQEMSIWLRKTETADKLYGPPTQQPFQRRFFTKRPTMAIEQALEEGDREENESEIVGEVEESQCSAMNAKRNFSNRKSGQSATEIKQKKSTCYNCKSNQHYFNDCDQPVTRIFCFRCGKDDVLAPNCDCRRNREQSKNELSIAMANVEHCDEPKQTPQ